MTDLPHWERPHFKPGGGAARLFYKVHGVLGGGLDLSRTRYRCAGIPAGIDINRHAADSDAFAFGLDYTFAKELRRTALDVYEAAVAAPQAVVLRGAIADPPDLDYFRDVIGVITALLDAGGVAVFDPFMLRWWTPAAWREQVFEPAIAAPRHHAVILLSEDEQNPGCTWVHTRGLAKFGRPDLSVRGVDREFVPSAVDLSDRFIEMLAFGAIVPDGQEIRMSTWPSGWTCHHRGSLDDPDFNNVHLAIERT